MACAQQSNGVRDFAFDENCQSNVCSIVVTQEPVEIASLSLLLVAPEDQIWLSGSVAWRAITAGTSTGRTDLVLQIHQDSATGPVVYQVTDSAEPGFDAAEVTPIDHVDTGVTGRIVTYVLTATAPLPGSQANITGPITFVGQVNRPLAPTSTSGEMAPAVARGVTIRSRQAQ